MKYAVCIPTYNRSELLQVAVGSIINDPSNPGFPIFVSSDSESGYRTKEIENLKKICNNRSKIYYIDIERSESYKRQLEKLSGLSREIIDIAMNGGSAGANRNRLLLLACTYGVDGVIFSDDDMKVEPGFIGYHNMALGNTVSQFISKLKNYKEITKLDQNLNDKDLEKNIIVFASGWGFCWMSQQEENKIYSRKSEYLFETTEIDAANLSLTNSVYSIIPFPTLHTDEDYMLGAHAKMISEFLNGIVLRGYYTTSIAMDQEATEKYFEKKVLDTDFVDWGHLIYISKDVAKNLPISLGESFGREFIKTIGRKIQDFVQSNRKQGGNLHRTGILYQNWPDLTDAAKRIDPIILEEFLLSNA